MNHVKPDKGLLSWLQHLLFGSLRRQISIGLGLFQAILLIGVILGHHPHRRSRAAGTATRRCRQSGAQSRQRCVWLAGGTRCGRAARAGQRPV